jgi:L-ascorbate metabolism protein UlaG (beta-lactamase superfamily)
MVVPTLVLLPVIAMALVVVAYRYLKPPSLAPYELIKGTATPSAGSLRVTFMGVTTLLFDDGETAILTDGFFSRPNKLKVGLGKIGPNPTRIEYALQRAGIDRLGAVLTAHSHYDHALDSAVVADRTGAILFGSESTANIACGVAFPEERMHVVVNGESLTLGRFKIKVIESPHSPGGHFPGKITTCLHPPARVKAYQEGGNYSYLITHGDHRILFHPSANFPPHGLRDVSAQIVFLGIGVLGKQSAGFVQEYWQKVVRASGATIVVPTHWDDFTRSLEHPLKPWAPLFDDFRGAMRPLLKMAADDDIAVRLMPAFEPIDISAFNV